MHKTETKKKFTQGSQYFFSFFWSFTLKTNEEKEARNRREFPA